MCAAREEALAVSTGSDDLGARRFGAPFSRFKKEIKGSHRLDKGRFKWAAQAGPIEETLRRKHALGFLNKGLNKQSPTRDEFTDYGQACLCMARGIFDLLRSHDAQILAAAIPRKLSPPSGYVPDLLRKDLVLLLERYYYLSNTRIRWV